MKDIGKGLGIGLMACAVAFAVCYTGNAYIAWAFLAVAFTANWWS